MGANLRQYVDPPRFTSAPYSLSAYVDWRTITGHELAGITYEPTCGLVGSTSDPCVVTGVGVAGPTKTPTASRQVRGAYPFTVYDEVECGPMALPDIEAFAQDVFTRSESFGVERAFWTGAVTTIAGNTGTVLPHLAANAQVLDTAALGTPIILQPAATIVTGVALDPVEALGRLEQALSAVYTGVGYIHVPVEVVSHLSAGHLMREGDLRLKTWNGNYVIPGAGYTGSAPDGTLTTGVRWLYATGALFGYRGPVRVLAPIGSRGPNGITESNLDRTVNTVKVIVERTYVIGWDCALLAIPVSVGGEIAGTYNSAT